MSQTINNLPHEISFYRMINSSHDTFFFLCGLFVSLAPLIIIGIILHSSGFGLVTIAKCLAIIGLFSLYISYILFSYFSRIILLPWFTYKREKEPFISFSKDHLYFEANEKKNAIFWGDIINIEYTPNVLRGGNSSGSGGGPISAKVIITQKDLTILTLDLDFPYESDYDLQEVALSQVVTYYSSLCKERVLLSGTEKQKDYSLQKEREIKSFLLFCKFIALAMLGLIIYGVYESFLKL